MTETLVNEKLVMLKREVDRLNTEARHENFLQVSDILISHGFTKEIFEDILDIGRIPHSYPPERLHQLESIVDMVLLRMRCSMQNIQ